MAAALMVGAASTSLTRWAVWHQARTATSLAALGAALLSLPRVG
jgi:uncharacterized membrane protein